MLCQFDHWVLSTIDNNGTVRIDDIIESEASRSRIEHLEQEGFLSITESDELALTRVGSYLQNRSRVSA